MRTDIEKTSRVAFGISRLPLELAAEFKALKRNLRGRTIATIILAHTEGLDIKKLVSSADELRRLGILLNQSLKVSSGRAVDEKALAEAVQKVRSLFP